MTFTSEIVDDTVSSETKTGIGDYTRLPESDDLELGGGDGVRGASRRWRLCLLWWMKLALLSLFLIGCAVVVLIFVGPPVVKKVVVPILQWEMATFSTPTLGLLVFACIALLPIVLLPATPCMWIAGMTFGYGYGFLLIMGASAVGMSVPFFIGSLFHQRIHDWLEKWPKKAAIVRLAGEGNWFHQFRAVTLLRLCPFPYAVFNYAAVATNVRYLPYICGSVLGTVPDTFFTIYSGRLLRTLADATSEVGFVSVEQVIYDAVGFTAALAATVSITIYGKRALEKLKAADELS